GGQTIRCLASSSPPNAERRSASAQQSNCPGDSIVQTLFSDIRYGVRSLLRAPSFALAVVAVLALGIGANAAIFSIVNEVRIRPAAGTSSSSATSSGEVTSAQHQTPWGAR